MLVMTISTTTFYGPAYNTQAWAQPAVVPGAIASCEPEAPEVERAIWKNPYYPSAQVWGYADRHSVVAGETFDLMLSTRPGAPSFTGRVEMLRIGHPAVGGERELVWRSSQTISVGCQDVSSTAAAIGPGWEPTLRAVSTAGWRTGYYTVDLVNGDDGHRELDVAYIVVTDPKRSGDILVKLGTNTYQAYNSWGGQSLYASDLYHLRGQIVAFDRPTPPSFLEYDRYLVTWLETIAERNNWTVDYATNFDLSINPSFMNDYRLVIVPGHDEYWAKEEFDAFEQRIFTHGQNVLFLGGDTAYAQIRYADVNRAPGGPDLGRQMVSYKQLDDPIRWRVPSAEADLLVTARFRDDRRRPETMLKGEASQGRFVPKSDRDPVYSLRVVRNDLPFFAGTGLAPGDSIGDVAGYEWGNTDPAGDGMRLWDSKRSRIAPLDPAAIKVLFIGSPVDFEGKPGKAESVYFVSPAGGKVFSAGTLRWVWGLSKPGFESEAFRHLNENMIRYFLEP
jgi:hypothetical protein